MSINNYSFKYICSRRHRATSGRLMSIQFTSCVYGVYSMLVKTFYYLTCSVTHFRDFNSENRDAVCVSK